MDSGPVLPFYSKWSYKVCKTGRRHLCGVDFMPLNPTICQGDWEPISPTTRFTHPGACASAVLCKDPVYLNEKNERTDRQVRDTLLSGQTLWPPVT